MKESKVDENYREEGGPDKLKLERQFGYCCFRRALTLSTLPEDWGLYGMWSVHLMPST
jgi:hypothetical protein